MSYDLLVTGRKIAREEFAAFFLARAHYEVSETQAIYENKETDVHFVFEFVAEAAGQSADSPDGDEELEDEDREVEHSVAFNLNFARPHYFALEADLELTAFFRHFGCTLYDPQENLRDQAYDSAAFLAGWNRGNLFGYSVLHRHEQADVTHTWPTAELEKMWRWNYAREERYAAIDKDIFIPKADFCLVEGRLATMAVWPDAISALLPRLDRLWIGREKLAPRSWFGRAKPDRCVVPFEEMAATLASYRVDGYEFEAFELPCPTTPPAVHEAVRKLSPTPGEIYFVPKNRVLNREIMEEARR